MAVVDTAIHTLSSLAACLSLAILGLVAHSVSLKDRLEHAAPPDLKSTGMSFLFWPACGGIVDCCLFLFLWIKAPSDENAGKAKTRYLNGLLFVASFYFMRPFIVLIYTFVEHNVETWACLLPKHSRNNTAEPLCKELRVARYLIIPLFVLGVVFLSLVVWLRFGPLRRNSVLNEDALGGAKSDAADVQV